MGRNAGESIARALTSRDPGTADVAPRARDRASFGPAGVSGDSRGTLTAAMSRYAGVVRDREGLQELLRVAGAVPVGSTVPLIAGGDGGLVPGTGVDLVEATNLHVVSVLIAAAAVQRTESRGCHRRRDFPDSWQEGRHTLLRWTPDGLKVGA
jgi:L-aspartate oxidase